MTKIVFVDHDFSKHRKITNMLAIIKFNNGKFNARRLAQLSGLQVKECSDILMELFKKGDLFHTNWTVHDEKREYALVEDMDLYL